MNTENNLDWLDALMIPKTAEQAADEIAQHNARVEQFMVAKRAMICPKCNGTGVLHHYRHIANGQCFKCGGSGQNV